MDGLPDGLCLLRSADTQPDDDTLFTYLRQMFEHGPIVEHRPGRRVNLIELEVGAEQAGAFGVLRSQMIEAEVFDLMGIGVDLPTGGIAISPLGADGDGGGVNGPGGQPACQEGFGPTVRAGRVEIPDPGLPGRVQHGMRVVFERLDVAPAGQICAVAKVQIAGPPQRGQTEAK